MGFLEITSKDLRLLGRDRRAAVVLVLLPMAFITILGLTTGRLLGWRKDNQLLRIGIVDHSESRQSRLIVERLQSIEGVKAFRLPSGDAAEEKLTDREITATVRIGPEFERRLNHLRPQDLLAPDQSRVDIDLSDLDVQVRSRPAAKMVRSVVDQLVLFATLQAAVPGSAPDAVSGSRADELLNGNPIGSSGSPAEGTLEETEADRNAADAEEETAEEAEESAEAGNPVYQTLVPAYTVMFAFFLVTIMSRSFIAERELGTLKRLRIAPVSATDLVLGKTLPFLVISLVQCSVLFLFGRLLFSMSWGSEPWLLLPILFSTSLAATGMGLLVATLVRTDSQVSAYANFLVITLAGISGCFMPRDWLPETMRSVSLATPHAWSLIAYHEALTSPTPQLETIFQSCLVLILFAAAFTFLGCLKMHHDRS